MVVSRLIWWAKFTFRSPLVQKTYPRSCLCLSFELLIICTFVTKLVQTHWTWFLCELTMMELLRCHPVQVALSKYQGHNAITILNYLSLRGMMCVWFFILYTFDLFTQIVYDWVNVQLGQQPAGLFLYPTKCVPSMPQTRLPIPLTNPLSNQPIIPVQPVQKDHHFDM